MSQVTAILQAYIGGAHEKDWPCRNCEHVSPTVDDVLEHHRATGHRSKLRIKEEGK